MAGLEMGDDEINFCTCYYPLFCRAYDSEVLCTFYPNARINALLPFKSMSVVFGYLMMFPVKKAIARDAIILLYFERYPSIRICCGCSGEGEASAQRNRTEQTPLLFWIHFTTLLDLWRYDRLMDGDDELCFGGYRQIDSVSECKSGGHFRIVGVLLAPQIAQYWCGLFTPSRG